MPPGGSIALPGRALRRSVRCLRQLLRTASYARLEHRGTAIHILHCEARPTRTALRRRPCDRHPAGRAQRAAAVARTPYLERIRHRQAAIGRGMEKRRARSDTPGTHRREPGRLSRALAQCEERTGVARRARREHRSSRQAQPLALQGERRIGRRRLIGWRCRPPRTRPRTGKRYLVRSTPCAAQAAGGRAWTASLRCVP